MLDAAPDDDAEEVVGYVAFVSDEHGAVRATICIPDAMTPEAFAGWLDDVAADLRGERETAN